MDGDQGEKVVDHVGSGGCHGIVRCVLLSVEVKKGRLGMLSDQLWYSGICGVLDLEGMAKENEYGQAHDD